MTHDVPQTGNRSRRLGPAAVGLALAVAVAACVSAPPDGVAVTSPSTAPLASPMGTTTPPGPTIAVTPSAASLTPTPTPTPATAETRPPPWTLVDASGQRIEGQVGTFQWDGVVSSSPLLGGSKATVRAEQLLDLATNGPLPTGWQATLHRDPAARRGVPFGEGAGLPVLRAPRAIGDWTLAVQVRYPVGDVLHSWRLIVTE